jgi:hypothetical protein
MFESGQDRSRIGAWELFRFGHGRPALGLSLPLSQVTLCEPFLDCLDVDQEARRIASNIARAAGASAQVSAGLSPRLNGLRDRSHRNAK